MFYSSALGWGLSGERQNVKTDSCRGVLRLPHLISDPLSDTKSRPSVLERARQKKKKR